MNSYISIFTVKTCAVPIVDQATANPESPINYNTAVTYTCNTGYTLSGDATRRCNADGSLTGTEPVCNSKYQGKCRLSILLSPTTLK